MEPLTEEQIQNWRRVLTMTLGPYALIMPVEEVQKMRNMMQEEADKMAKDKEEYDGG